MWLLYPYRDEGWIAETVFDSDQTVQICTSEQDSGIELHELQSFQSVSKSAALRAYNVGIPLNISFAPSSISEH